MLFGVFLNESVALMPLKNFPGSLSHQVRRSRYESILALIRLCEEYNEIDTCIKKLAFKRALSRANTYNKFLNNRLFSVYLVLYFLSKFYFPENSLGLLYKCLKVFTKDIDRPNLPNLGIERNMVIDFASSDIGFNHYSVSQDYRNKLENLYNSAARR